jgi:hypothetical protein
MPCHASLVTNSKASSGPKCPLHIHGQGGRDGLEVVTVMAVFVVVIEIIIIITVISGCCFRCRVHCARPRSTTSDDGWEVCSRTLGAVRSRVCFVGTTSPSLAQRAGSYKTHSPFRTKFSIQSITTQNPSLTSQNPLPNTIPHRCEQTIVFGIRVQTCSPLRLECVSNSSAGPCR